MCKNKETNMKAGEVLSIMTARLQMQNDGITTPPENIKKYTKELVKKLSLLDGDEEIELEITDSNKVKTIRVATGEVIAERDDENT